MGVRGRSASRTVDGSNAELDKVKPRVKPWRRPEEREGSGGVCSLDRDKVSGYRQLMARCCCVAQDRADIQYAEAWHARQRVIWRPVKRLWRCSEGRPRAIAKFSCQQQPSPIDVFSDSDWAGCTLTARSTRGGATIMEHVSFSSCECVRCPVAGSTASRPASSSEKRKTQL